MDYRNLHLLSSAVLYNTARKPSGKLLKVDRIVDKRRVGHNGEYLIKWNGWPTHACSWEPEDQVTTDLLRTYEKPLMPDSYRLEVAGANFYRTIITNLKGIQLLPWKQSWILMYNGICGLEGVS